MELYGKELGQAKNLPAKYRYDPDEFSFTMSYFPPDPDAAGMFTVRYLVTVTHSQGVQFEAEGGIGLDWVALFEEALEQGYFT